MGRRSNADIAAAAAAAASEAARTLQARGQEKASEPQPDQPEGHIEPGRVEKLLANRPSKLAMDDILSRREQEPTEPKIEPEVKTEPEVKAETPVEPEAPKTVRVKVDGEEFDAPADEVEAAGGITSYQRDKASDNRLRKANETVAESKKMMAQVADWLQKQNKTTEKPEQSDLQYIMERINKSRFGTDEEAAQAHLEIAQRITKQVNPQDIETRVTTKIAHDAAVKQFDSEFSDLAKNPILLNAVIAQRHSKLTQLQGNTASIDWTVFYRNIGNEVRSAFGRQSQPATTTDKTPSTPSQGSDKEARKASIVNLPTAAARAELPKEEKEPTPEEARKQWLADARKARGQG